MEHARHMEPLLYLVRRIQAERLLRVRRPMLCEPLLAHPSEMGAISATRHTISGEDDNRDRRDDSADDEQHGFAANRVLSRRIAILAFLVTAVCAFVHM